MTSLGVSNYSLWENIPGDRNLLKTHTINFFNVTSIVNGVPNVTLLSNVTFNENLQVVGNVTETNSTLAIPSNATVLEFTTSSNYTIQGSPNLDQNITTINYDLFAALAADQDETPYLIAA